MPNKPAILCVDDEKIVLNGLKEQLNRIFLREFSIECAENGSRALEIYHELIDEGIEVPVIISDHIMPGMKGDELLTQFYHLNPNIKNILLTGQADADAVGRAVNYAHLYRYLSKPWEQQDLVLTVQEAIRSYFQDKTLNEQNAMLKNVNEQLEAVNEKLKQKVILFNKFVPTQFLQILHIDLDQPATLQKEYIELAQSVASELTIMFADIRSFTHLCESFTAEQAFKFVNHYLAMMGPIISENNGFVDKFIGDAIMALFITPENAINAAISMQSQLYQYNRKQNRSDFVPISIGIGINTGNIMLGTVGNENRLQTTVIGDAVNLTAHTEKLTKEFFSPIIITEHTFKALKDPNNFKIRFLDQALVKGKLLPIDFYEILDALPEDVRNKKLSINDIYQKGVQAFKLGDLMQARSYFEECLKINQDDYPSQLYLKKVLESIASSMHEGEKK